MNSDERHPSEQISVARGLVCVTVYSDDGQPAVIRLEAERGYALEGIAPGEYEVVPLTLTREAVLAHLRRTTSGADLMQFVEQALDITDDDVGLSEDVFADPKLDPAVSEIRRLADEDRAGELVERLELRGADVAIPQDILAEAITLLRRLPKDGPAYDRLHKAVFGG